VSSQYVSIVWHCSPLTVSPIFAVNQDFKANLTPVFVTVSRPIIQVAFQFHSDRFPPVSK